MDQRRIAGVGNIYANEALFEAGIDPSKPTDNLSLDEFARLHAAVTDVLGRAVNSSGTTVRDYRTGTGEQGRLDRKSTRLNSSHLGISYAVFCLKKKTARS